MLDILTAIALLIASVRAEAGLQAVRPDPALDAIAQVRAETQAQQMRLSHDMASIDVMLSNAGIVFDLSLENLAAVSGKDEPVAMWLNSPTHRDVLLSPEADAFGLGAAKGSDGRTYVALLMIDEPVVEPVRVVTVFRCEVGR